MNYYPREYLELWDIKETIANTPEEAKTIKQNWKALNFQVAARTISYADLARCSIIKIIGLKDKTNTKTPEEIKKELKTLF